LAEVFIVAFFRITAIAATVLSLTACSGNGGLGGGLGGGGLQQCNPGTQVQLARPQSQTAASNVSSVEVVANGNGNVLGQSPGSWYLQAQDNFGNQPIFSNALTPVADPTGYHPFPSDFFYSGNLGTTLPGGGNWTISLVQSQGIGQVCTPLPVGIFST
jgi:hypothetical protein